MPSSPPESSGPDALSPDEAFALLGNDTRADILQALWDAFEPGWSDDAVPYSELYDGVDIEDTGNFTYHLQKLTGPFVRHTEEGYELKQTGINVVRAVIAGIVTDDPAFGPTRVAASCPLCDAPVEVAYVDELMTVSCTSCHGFLRWNGDPGVLFGGLVPPVGIEQHTIEGAFRAAVSYVMHEIATFHEGVCPSCSSPVETTLTACTAHDPGRDTLCPTCDRTHLAEVVWVCPTCKRGIYSPARIAVLNDPDVTAFYHEHDVEHRFATWETAVRSAEVGEELVSEDPLGMRFTVPAGDDELRLTLDGELDVNDVTR